MIRTYFIYSVHLMQNPKNTKNSFAPIFFQLGLPTNTITTVSPSIHRWRTIAKDLLNSRPRATLSNLQAGSATGHVEENFAILSPGRDQSRTSYAAWSREAPKTTYRVISLGNWIAWPLERLVRRPQANCTRLFARRCAINAYSHQFATAAAAAAALLVWRLRG